MNSLCIDNVGPYATSCSVRPKLFDPFHNTSRRHFRVLKHLGKALMVPIANPSHKSPQGCPLFKHIIWRDRPAPRCQRRQIYSLSLFFLHFLSFFFPSSSKRLTLYRSPFAELRVRFHWGARGLWYLPSDPWSSKKKESCIFFFKRPQCTFYWPVQGNAYRMAPGRQSRLWKFFFNFGFYVCICLCTICSRRCLNQQYF